MFQGDKFVYSELTTNAVLIVRMFADVPVSVCKPARTCVLASVSVRPIAYSAPSTRLPPLGRTASFAASPPACHSLLTDPANHRPLQQSHRCIILLKTATYTCAKATCICSVLHILDICLLIFTLIQCP